MGDFSPISKEAISFSGVMETNERAQATEVSAPAVGIIPGASFTGLDAGVVSHRWSPDSRIVALELEDRRSVHDGARKDYIALYLMIKPFPKFVTALSWYSSFGRAATP